MEQMVNVNKLRGKMFERGINVSELANRIGMQPQTLYRRLNGGCEKMFIKEANMIVRELHLSTNEAMSIFFANYVAPCDSERT